MAFADNLQSFRDSLQEIDINDLDFENVGGWPIALKVIALALLFIFVNVAGYFYSIKDLRIQLQGEEAKEVQLRSEYENKAFQAANLDSLRKQMEEMEKSFGAMISQLPSDTEVPGLLEDITAKGVDNGLDFKKIELKPEKAAEFYVELPIDIDVLGTYHDFGSFVSGIAGLPRIVTLHDFTILPSKDDNSILNLTIVAKTYRYKKEDEGVAPPKPGKPGAKGAKPAQNKAKGGK